MIKKKQPVILIYNNKKYREGEEVNVLVSARKYTNCILHKQGNEIYLCHDDLNGSQPNFRYNKAGSWVFTQDSETKELTDSVIILTGEEKGVLRLYGGALQFTNKKGENRTIALIEQFPSNCGSSICHNFSENASKELLERSYNAQVNWPTSNTMIQLTNNQIYSKKLIEKFGFKKIIEYKNKNSKNIITAYYYGNIDQPKGFESNLKRRIKAKEINETITTKKETATRA